MRILTEEEGKNLHPMGGGSHTMVHVMVSQLKPGQALVIEKKDWLTKHPPYRVIRAVAKKFNYNLNYGRMPDGLGWLVKRVA